MNESQGKMTPALRERLATDPGDRIDVLVRIQGDPEIRATQAQSLGLEVRHRFSIVSALAARGEPRAIHRLAEEDWVDGIELDIGVSPA